MDARTPDARWIGELLKLKVCNNEKIKIVCIPESD